MTDKEIALRLTEAAYNFCGNIKYPGTNHVIAEIKTQYLQMLKDIDIDNISDEVMDNRIQEIIDRYNDGHCKCNKQRD